MKQRNKYYLLRFVLEALVFMGILSLIDWFMSEINPWYTYVIQGILFGFFMTFYSYWSDKQKQKKEENKGEKEEVKEEVKKGNG